VSSTLKATAALLRKDLILELRTKQTLPAMMIFCTTVFVLFHFGLDRSSLEGSLAAGVFWVSVLLAAVLGISRLFNYEHEDDGLAAFSLTGASPTALLLSKAVSLWIYLLLLELTALPLFSLLLLKPSPIESTHLLVLTALLVNTGVAAIGTLISALATQTQSRELITAIFTLPLLIPIVIAASSITSTLWLEGGGSAESQWFTLLCLYDTVFLLSAYALFDYLLED